MENVDLEKLDAILEQHDRATSSLIPILQEAQAAYGWLPQPVIDSIAEHLNIPSSTVYGVVTFYAQFYLAPQGRHNVRVCQGTACHVKGSSNIIAALKRELGIGPGQTTDDLSLSLERVACVGSCALAPVVVVDGEVHGRMTPEKTLKVVKGLG